MPMIQVKVTTPLTAEQDVKIHNGLTQAVVEVFRKPIDYVMINVEPESDLWMAGQKLAKGAFVSACLMGDMENKDCDAFTARVCELFKQTLDIEGAKVYTTFQTINQWGWDGKIL